MADYPPDLNAIPDLPQETYWIKSSLRWLADRVGELQSPVGASTADLSAQIADLTTRVGVLERRGAPTIGVTSFFYGAWRQTASAVGAGSFTWDTEDLNVGGGWTRQATNTQLRCNFSGLLIVLADPYINTLLADRAVELYKNASLWARGLAQITAGQFDSGKIFTAMQVVTGDFVELRNTADTRYGDANRWTKLALVGVSL